MEFMNYDSLFFKGAILGLILPTLAFLVYSIATFDGDAWALYKQLKVMGVHSHVLSLCTLLNLIPFLIFMRTNLEKSARGILMTTIFIALLVMINKFLF
tara:strand:- start:28 stop:324 length:297 start_codon:yes stop_codon:yes gene_type:complete